MSNIISNTENRPIGSFENRPTEQLVQGYSQGKWISNKDLEELAIEKYKINGKGITFFDVVNEYKCSKAKAQLKLKNACIEKVKDGKKKFSFI